VAGRERQESPGWTDAKTVFLLGPTYANFSEEAPVRLMRCFRQLAVDRYRPSATRDDPARK